MATNMMDRPLLISGLLDHAQNNHPNTEIVSRRVEGDIHRCTMGEAGQRAKQLANALKDLGVGHGDRVATLAWNTYRHYEIYFAVSGMGAITHTINPRLFPEQVIYIINHAQDQYVFVDINLLPILEAVKDKISLVKGFIVLADKDKMPETTLPNVICYEELIEQYSDDFVWPEFDENTNAALCYTSGTTGNPKGVMYTHRSTVLHAFSSISNDVLGLSSESSILPVVPMFHVNAWGIPYSATLTGSKLVMPGAGMDGESLYELIKEEEVDLLLGVPTVWLNLLNYLDEINSTLDSVENVVVGGSAAPLSMVKKFQETHDAFLIHAWGMTEMSPIGTINNLTRAMKKMPLEERYQLQLKQGRPVFGVEVKIVNDENHEQPKDGKSFGRLLVRGPWIADGYYLHQDKSAFEGGWLDTGDVATLDEQNYVQIVDRSKDVIKSGGEWISSIDLENAAVNHPDLVECCVIGVRHPKWDERPLLLAIKNKDAQVEEKDVLEFLEDKVAKWWLPDAVVFVDELPHTATGKLLKIAVRDKYQDYLMEPAV